MYLIGKISFNMKKIYTVLLTLMMFGLGFGQSNIATIDRANGGTATATGTAPNISAIGLTRGSGILQATGGDYNCNGWSSTFAEADANDEYIQWSVTADASYEIELTEFDIRVDRSGSGPANWQIFYSLDNFATAGIDITGGQTVGTSGAAFNFDSLSINSGTAGTITFRLYAWGASSGGGTFDVEGVPGWSDFGITDPGMRLIGNINLISGCTAPATQASAYNTTSVGTTSATLNWTSGDGDEVLVLVKEGTAVDSDPINGTSYTGNTVFTSGDEIGTGNYVVQSGSATSSVSITGLNEATTYHVAVYEYNTLGTCYNLTELTGNFTTDCSTPTDVSTFTAVSGNTTIDLSWANSSCFDEILVVAKAGSSVTVTPTGDGTAYTADTVFGSGTDLGTNEYAVYKGTGTSVTVTGLTNGTEYFFTAFARRGTSWSTGTSISTIPNVVEEAIAGDLIITEVSGDDSDGSNNDNGYMEIYNRSNKIINLDNIEARYFNTNPGSSTQQVALSGTLSPGAFIIVTQNATNYGNEYTDTADATGSDFFFNGGDDGCDVYHTSNGIIDQFNDNGSGQSPWTWSDNFTYYRNSSDSGAIEENWTQDETDNPRVKTNLYFWTGNTDSAWTNPGNWDEALVPSNTTDVVITDQTNAPLISTSIDISNLTIETNGNLTVEKTGNLETSGNLNNNGNLNLESDSNEFSSLIVDGSVSGSVSYERYVNTNDPVNGNDLISAPLSGQAFDVFISNNTNILANPSGPEVLFGGFDNDDSSGSPFEFWSETDTTPLTAGVGYRSGIDTAAGSNIVTFEGTVNTSLVEVAIDQGTASILNLVGNPFPSYLDAQAFLSENAGLLDPSAQVIYGYNDSTDGTSADDYTIISAIENNTLDIAPGQGFFIASNSTGGNIQFTTNSPDMRVTSTDDDFIIGRNSTSIYNVNIRLNNSTDSYITKVYFTEFSDLGLDPGYDASLLGAAAPPFALFSHLVQENMGIPFATQAIGKTDYANVTIPLGVNANQGEQLTFSIAENTLPSTVNVYLDDDVANTSTLLNSSDYVLNPATNLSGTGRFYLRFADNSLSTLENDFDTISIYANQVDRTINIAGQLLENTVANVYDIQGRLVTSKTLSSDSTLQAVDASSLSTGIYVIKLSNGNQTKTEKVILK